MTSGPSHTRLRDVQGAAHTGSGDLNVTWVLGTDERLLRTGTGRLQIVREYRRHLARCFVPPRNYGQAARRLERPGGSVLLDGPVGGGRRAAATMLLEGVPSDDERVEELTLDIEESGPEPASGIRYLLDLSSVGADGFERAQRALRHYRSLVEQAGAHMVAVLPAGLETSLASDLTDLVVVLERPRGRSVFCRHLRVHRVAFDPDLLAAEETARLLATAPMRQLARVAQLVARARDSRRFGTSFDAWLTEALAAATSWSAEVAGQLRDHRGVGERALLLSAGMLHDAPAEAAHVAAQCLLDVLGHRPGEDEPELGRADLGEQLEKLSVSWETDGRIQFPRLAYDGAVRSRFWRNFPGLRPAFRDWVGACLELTALGAADRRRLLVRFAEQALAAGRPEDLCVLAERWTRPEAARQLHAHAAAALELGLTHEQYGSRVRAQVYAWVTGSRLPSALARVLTDVCQQVMAVTHPEQALVRLRHLALRQRGAEAAAARSALLDLARGDQRLFGHLVERLLPGPSTPPVGRTGILLELMEPRELRVVPPWPSLTLAWRAVMEAETPQAWTPLARRWLETARRSPHRDAVLTTLLTGAAGRPALLDHLYLTACDWAARSPAGRSPGGSPPGDRAELADRLCRRIDLLRGIEEPAAPVR
jgi:hypothetical protein